VARPEDRVDLAVSEISEVPAILRLLTPSGFWVAWQKDQVDLSVSEISMAPATRYRQAPSRSSQSSSEPCPGWDWLEAHGRRKLPWALVV